MRTQSCKGLFFFLPWGRPSGYNLTNLMAKLITDEAIYSNANVRLPYGPY